MHGELLLFYFTKTIKLLYMPAVLCTYQMVCPRRGAGNPRRIWHFQVLKCQFPNPWVTIKSQIPSRILLSNTQGTVVVVKIPTCTTWVKLQIPVVAPPPPNILGQTINRSTMPTIYNLSALSHYEVNGKLHQKPQNQSKGHHFLHFIERRTNLSFITRLNSTLFQTPYNVL